MGTISTETQQLAEAVRLACIELRTKINGNEPTLAALNTTAKGSVVAAINEVLALAGGGGSGAWDDITGKPAAVTALSGTNTGDETTSTIKAKLGITTLSGSNTGDQDLSGLLSISTAASTYAPLASPSFTGNVTLSGATFTNTVSLPYLVVTDSATFGSGCGFVYDPTAATNHRTALGLTALATTTPGTGVAAALAATPSATGGFVRFNGNIGAAEGTSLSLSGGIGTGITTVNTGAPTRSILKITSGIAGFSHDTIAFYENYDGSDVFHMQFYHKALYLGGRSSDSPTSQVKIFNSQGFTRALEVDGNSQFAGNLTASGSLKNGSLTVAAATASSSATAVAAGAGAWIYISDESGGATQAFSDGTVWRRVSDRASIS